MKLTDDDEFVPEWDVYRDTYGHPVTITEEQMYAIWHALGVVESVRRSEEHQSIWSNGNAEVYKSRLLGRMLLDGLPPTRTRPPKEWGGPNWDALPGGDPLAYRARREQARADVEAGLGVSQEELDAIRANNKRE